MHCNGDQSLANYFDESICDVSEMKYISLSVSVLTGQYYDCFCVDRTSLRDFL